MLNTTRLEVVKGTGMNAVTQYLGKLHLIDSSTITLCVSRYGWAEFRKTKGGVKLHLRLKFVDGDVMPDKVIVTNAKVSDKSQMDALVVEEKDALDVFDRGYVGYKKFDHYCANGIRFVTRIKGNAVIEIVEDRPLQPGSPIKRNSTVYLGVPGDTRMVNPLRLLETEDSEGKPVRILTNDFGLSAQEVCDIYRIRWQIELFFKWIKQHFCVKHFYGTLRKRLTTNYTLRSSPTAYCCL